MLKNLRVEIKTGLVCVLPYLVILLLLIAIGFLSRDPMAIIPLLLITGFPIYVLIEVTLLQIFNQDFFPPSISGMIAGIIFGAIINSTLLFVIGYLVASFVKKRSKLG
jgi:hypothetical protein